MNTVPRSRINEIRKKFLGNPNSCTHDDAYGGACNTCVKRDLLRYIHQLHIQLFDLHRMCDCQEVCSCKPNCWWENMDGKPTIPNGACDMCKETNDEQEQAPGNGGTDKG